MNDGQSARGSSSDPPGAASAAVAAAPSVAAAAAASDSDVEVEEEDDAEVEDGVAALRSAPIESASAGASSPRSSRPARTGSRSGSGSSAVALPPADLNHADLDRIRAALPKTSKLADKIVGE